MKCFLNVTTMIAFL